MRKQIQNQYLSEIPVKVIDTTISSPKYFNVTYCENVLKLGKNLLRFTGVHNVFTEGTEIGIEILDFNGTPIYYEAVLESKTAIISIFITSDIPPGEARIILCGCINGSETFNLRWERTVVVNVENTTDSEIVYTTLPEVYINPATSSYLDKTFQSNNRIVSNSLNNINYYQLNGKGILATSSLSTTGFDSTGVELFLNFDTTEIIQILPENNNIPSYVSQDYKLNVLNPGIAELLNPIKLNTEPFTWVPTFIEFQNITVKTEQTSSLTTETENKTNVLTAYFTGLEPKSGFVSKIRSFYKSLGREEWQLSNITNIEINETGFTPNIYTASLYIPTEHRNDTLDFRFEFLNNSGQPANKDLVTKNYKFIGGNTYIGGDDNLMTGSLFVAGQTGTGVQISGRNQAAMLRSIGYTGFLNALSGSGSAGFVLYSGSIQPLLNSAEVYGGVGFELVANTSSYFRYKTDGGGLLDIRTDNFYIGNQNTFISGSNNSIEILVKDPLPPLTKFHLRPSGEVTASAFIAFTGSNDTSKTLMLDTFSGLISGKNIGRNLNRISLFTIPYTDTTTLPPQNILNTANNLTALNDVNILWQPIAEEFTYTLPFENAVLIMGNASFIKDSTSATFPSLSSIDDAKVSVFLRLSVSGITTSSFATFGNNQGFVNNGTSGSIVNAINNNNLGTTSTSYTIASVTASGSLQQHTPFKIVATIPSQFSDKISYINLEYAVVRLNSNSGTTIDINFRCKFTNINIMTTRTLMSTTATGLGDVIVAYDNDTYPTV